MVSPAKNGKKPQSVPEEQVLCPACGGTGCETTIAEADSTLLRLPIDMLEDCFRGNAMMEARVMRNLATALSAYLLRANAVRVRS